MECETTAEGATDREGEGGGGGRVREGVRRGLWEEGWTLNNDVGCQGMCPLPVRSARGCFQEIRQQD